MRIDSKVKIAAVTMLRLREFMRDYPDDWELADVACHFKCSSSEAVRVADKLVERGFAMVQSEMPATWARTSDGGRLAAASATAPMKLSVVERKLGRFSRG